MSAISTQLHAAAPDVDPLAKPSVPAFAGQKAAPVPAIAQGVVGVLYVLTDVENNNQPNRHFASEMFKLTPRWVQARSFRGTLVKSPYVMLAEH